MESKVVTAKERLDSTLKRYGEIQIFLGLGCLIITFVSIGIDKKVCDNLGKKEVVITNAAIPTFSFDKENIMLGLDGESVVSAIWIVVTGIVSAYMARNADYRFEKTIMKFYTMESKVVTAKERLGSTLKRYGEIQILLGLGCLIITFVSIGIDKKVCDNLGKKGIVPAYMARNADYSLIRTVGY
ncbi:unnamed protein product [Mytilus edulis]|uniref:Uncharacterized protein n=1 Tax=Mytilus edulis TaxID=6550 RepID=A0A8S3V773_MYTED|nr:unnamed protein product [Mytilus edulis]